MGSLSGYFSSLPHTQMQFITKQLCYQPTRLRSVTTLRTPTRTLLIHQIRSVCIYSLYNALINGGQIHRTQCDRT